MNIPSVIQIIAYEYIKGVGGVFWFYFDTIHVHNYHGLNLIDHKIVFG